MKSTEGDKPQKCQNWEKFDLQKNLFLLWKPNSNEKHV